MACTVSAWNRRILYGKINTAMFAFLSDKRRFADLFNGVFFHGQNSMPCRLMLHDSMEYGKQLKELKRRNLNQGLLHTSAERLCGMATPAYTLCLCHGEKPWDGPLSLRDMMDFGHDSDNMSRFFADYPFRLFCVNTHADFSIFHTELAAVFAAMNLRSDKKRLYSLLKKQPSLGAIDADTVRIISVILNMPKNCGVIKTNI